jgi:hypothetical protein
LEKPSRRPTQNNIYWYNGAGEGDWAVLDRIVPIILSLVVSVLLFLAAVTGMGWEQKSPVLSTLTALGGPAGKLGGLAVIGCLFGIGYFFANAALVRKFEAHVAGLAEKGVSTNDILVRIARYPISKNLKRRLRMSIRTG